MRKALVDSLLAYCVEVNWMRSRLRPGASHRDRGWLSNRKVDQQAWCTGLRPIDVGARKTGGVFVWRWCESMK